MAGRSALVDNLAGPWLAAMSRRRHAGRPRPRHLVLLESHAQEELVARRPFADTVARPTPLTGQRGTDS